MHISSSSKELLSSDCTKLSTFIEAYISELDKRMAAIRGLLIIILRVNLDTDLLSIPCPYCIAQMPERQELEKLRKQLEAFKITNQMDCSLTENLKAISQRSLQNYLEKSLKGGKEVQTIKKHLNELKEDLLISDEMCTWALEMVDKMNLEQPSTSEYSIQTLAHTK